MAMAHYLVGLPLAALFAFGFHAGLFGLWLGRILLRRGFFYLPCSRVY